MLCEQRLETWQAEHLALSVMGLDQTIAVEKHTISGGQRHFVVVIACSGHHPKGHAGRAEFRNAAAVSSIRAIMPGIGIVKPTALRIKNSIEAGDKHARWSFCIEQVVYPRKYFTGRECPLGRSTNHSAGGCHHQGSGYPLICDITDDETKPAILKREEIVEVAADLACRPVVWHDPPPGER